MNFISTNEKAIAIDDKSQMKARLLIKRDILTISGEVYDYDKESNKVFVPVYYRKLSFTNNHKIWKQLEAIGKNFGTIINYEVENKKAIKRSTDSKTWIVVVGSIAATAFGVFLMTILPPHTF